MIYYVTTNYIFNDIEFKYYFKLFIIGSIIYSLIYIIFNSNIIHSDFLKTFMDNYYIFIVVIDNIYLAYSYSKLKREKDMDNIHNIIVDQVSGNTTEHVITSGNTSYSFMGKGDLSTTCSQANELKVIHNTMSSDTSIFLTDSDDKKD